MALARHRLVVINSVRACVRARMCVSVGDNKTWVAVSVTLAVDQGKCLSKF